MDEGFSRYRIFPRLDITVSPIAIWGTTYNTYPLCRFFSYFRKLSWRLYFLLALLQSSQGISEYGVLIWCLRVESNRRPVVFQTTALTGLSYQGIKLSTAFTQRPKGGPYLISTEFKLEQVTGFEPVPSAWQAEILPLYYTCKTRPAYLPESRPRC